MNRTRLARLVISLPVVMVLLCCVVQSTNAAGELFLLAQTEAAPNSMPAPNVISGRTYEFEIGLVTVLFGGAIYVVCKSSNRHT